MSPPARLPPLSDQLSSIRNPASGPGDVFFTVMVVTISLPLRLVAGFVNSTVASPRNGEISFLGAAGAAGAGVCANATGANKNPRAAAKAIDRWINFIRGTSGQRLYTRLRALVALRRGESTFRRSSPRAL